MTFDVRKGHAALRRGRSSVPGGEYFLTIATHDRWSSLATAGVAAAIFSELDTLSADGSWTLRCATIMPDHLHLLIRLGARLTLGQTVQRLKARTAGMLRQAGGSWMRGFFDRRLRPDDERLPVFLYVYLNPYRAGLVGLGQPWPCFRCSAEDWTWFQHQLDCHLPFPEWLR